MSADPDIGKRVIEDMILDQVLEALPVITGRRVTEEWYEEATKAERAPDHIIGLDGLPFGVDLAEVCEAENAVEFAVEAFRLALKKSQSYERYGLFQVPIILVLYLTAPLPFNLRDVLPIAVAPEDFEALGFAEVWAVDFSDAYDTPGHPFRQPDLFCFKPQKWFGFHQVGNSDRIDFG
jgi:hypothetical protein